MSRVAVVVGNPKPRSRTLTAATYVATELAGHTPDLVVDLKGVPTSMVSMVDLGGGWFWTFCRGLDNALLLNVAGPDGTNTWYSVGGYLTCPGRPRSSAAVARERGRRPGFVALWS